MNKLLTGKTAIVYGAGAIGSAVITTFVEEGAAVFVASKTEVSLAKIADQIKAKGGSIETAVVDALDKQAVEAFVDSVAQKTGKVDISFCATSTHTPGGEQGSKLSEITYEDFALPITDYTKAQFLTANAASKQMIKQQSGVILMITAIASRIPIPYTAGFGVAWAAVEAMSRTLAAELGTHGIRTVYLHSAGSPESAESIERTESKRDDLATRKEEWGSLIGSRNLLQQWPTLEQIGDMAAFMVSDKAGNVTGTGININGGMIND